MSFHLFQCCNNFIDPDAICWSSLTPEIKKYCKKYCEKYSNTFCIFKNYSNIFFTKYCKLQYFLLVLLTTPLKAKKKLQKNESAIPLSTWCDSADSCAECELDWWYSHVHWHLCDVETILQSKTRINFLDYMITERKSIRPNCTV